MEYQNDGPHVILHLGSHLEKNSLAEQKDLLTHVLSLKKPIILSAAELIRVDTPALQLFISFLLAATKENVEWKWIDASSVLTHTAKLLGMSDILQLPEET